MDLPGDLALPLTSGAPWWYWLGGRPAMDFVNTRRERWWRDVETLVTPSDLVEWLLQADLLDQPATARPAQVQAARRLREAINTGIQAATDDTPMPLSALSEITSWLAYASPVLRLAAGRDGHPQLVDAPPANAIKYAVARVALDAANLLGTEDQRQRLRVCASPTCSARFYDASRGASRRWCSMRGCGNAAKARRHRAQSDRAVKAPSAP